MARESPASYSSKERDFYRAHVGRLIGLREFLTAAGIEGFCRPFETADVVEREFEAMVFLVGSDSPALEDERLTAFLDGKAFFLELVFHQHCGQ